MSPTTIFSPTARAGRASDGAGSGRGVPRGGGYRVLAGWVQVHDPGPGHTPPGQAHPTPGQDHPTRPLGSWPRLMLISESGWL